MYLGRWRKGRSRWHRVWKTMMHSQIDAIAKLALHAGLRRDEIFNAPIEDIHYDNEYVVVRYAAAKNKDAVVKPREVPMTQGLASALHRWFEFRTEIDPDHDFPWLSLTAFGPRGADFHKLAMSHDRFSELLGTVGDGYELHRLRHTCATEWLRSGMPLEHLRDLLGHAKIAQTLAYAQIDKTDITKSMSRSAVDFETAVGRAA
jgi:integrase